MTRLRPNSLDCQQCHILKQFRAGNPEQKDETLTWLSDSDPYVMCNVCQCEMTTIIDFKMRLDEFAYSRICEKPPIGCVGSIGLKINFIKITACDLHSIEAVGTALLGKTYKCHLTWLQRFSFSWDFKLLARAEQINKWLIRSDFSRKNLSAHNTMVAKIDLISEASHKHAGEVTALVFDKEHLYSGSADGVINVRINWLDIYRNNLVHFRNFIQNLQILGNNLIIVFIPTYFSLFF